MSMSMISSMGNFLPKKTVAAVVVQIPSPWVAVGYGGVIAKSTDGNVWTPAFTSVAGNVGGITTVGRGVAYGKDGTGAGLWVAVGVGGIIAKSTDGNVWTPAAGSATNKGGITSGWGVAYGKDALGAGLWVAGGNSGVIAKSTDGNVWTPAATVSGVTGKGGITSYANGVAYGKDALGAGLWVAVGGGGIIAKSIDGNVWTPAYTSVAGNVGGITAPGYGVAYGKDGTGAGLWVAVGAGGLIAKSPDGNIWTPAATSADGSKGGITSYGVGVAYGKDALGAGLWVAVGGGGLIAKSTDGNVWTPAATKGGITTYGKGVAYGKDETGAGLWVAIGEGGLIAKSTDGNVWTPAATSADGSKGGITDSGLGVGFKKNIYEPFFINTPGMTASSNYRGVSMSANGQYILICRSGSPGGVFLSINYGASFTLISTLGTTINWTCCSMTPNGQVMAVAGNPSGIYRSSNYGTSWTGITGSDKYHSLHISYNTYRTVALIEYASYGLNVYEIDDITLGANGTTQTLISGVIPVYFPQTVCISKSGNYIVALCYGVQYGIAIKTNSGYSYYECNSLTKQSNSGSMNADSQHYVARINYDETKIFIGVSSGPLMGIWTFNILNASTVSATSEKNAAFSAITPTPNNIRDLVISRDNLTMIVTTDTKTYYSFDGGIVWTDVYLGKLQCVAISDNANSIIATSTNNLIPQISRT
jgi:hypothetical protein